MISGPLYKYVIKAAIRDRLVLSLIAVSALGVSLSIFMGSAALSEKDQFMSVFAAGGLRFAGLLGLVLFVVFYIRRAFDAKDVDYILSRPISRTHFILSHSLAFMTLAAFVAALFTLTLYISNPNIHPEGLVLWGSSLFAEYAIMVCAGLFFTMILSSATTSAMACIGFYLLCRMMGQILGIIDAGLSNYDNMMNMMQVISMMMPRLDLMGQTSWLVYGPQGGVGFVFLTAQAIVYVILLNAAALFDLAKRQF